MIIISSEAAVSFHHVRVFFLMFVLKWLRFCKEMNETVT